MRIHKIFAAIAVACTIQDTFALPNNNLADIISELSNSQNSMGHGQLSGNGGGSSHGGSGSGNYNGDNYMDNDDDENSRNGRGNSGDIYSGVGNGDNDRGCDDCGSNGGDTGSESCDDDNNDSNGHSSSSGASASASASATARAEAIASAIASAAASASANSKSHSSGSSNNSSSHASATASAEAIAKAEAKAKAEAEARASAEANAKASADALAAAKAAIAVLEKKLKDLETVGDVEMLPNITVSGGLLLSESDLVALANSNAAANAAANAQAVAFAQAEAESSANINLIQRSSFCDTTGLDPGDGTQNRAGSCSSTVQGAIPDVDSMVSTIILEPRFGDVIMANATFNITVQTKNLELGKFDDPNTRYYLTPQTLNADGIIQGHQHVVIQKMAEDDPNAPPTLLDAKVFDFFKGLDGLPEPNNKLSTVVEGLAAGLYRICTITGTFAHQPVIMPVAQRGSQDDCIRILVQDSVSGHH